MPPYFGAGARRLRIVNVHEHVARAGVRNWPSSFLVLAVLVLVGLAEQALQEARASARSDLAGLFEGRAHRARGLPALVARVGKRLRDHEVEPSRQLGAQLRGVPLEVALHDLREQLALGVI